MKVFVLPCGRRDKAEVGFGGAVLAIPPRSRPQPPPSREAQMSLMVPFASELHPPRCCWQGGGHKQRVCSWG